MTEIKKVPDSPVRDFFVSGIGIFTDIIRLYS